MILWIFASSVELLHDGLQLNVSRLHAIRTQLSILAQQLAVWSSVCLEPYESGKEMGSLAEMTDEAKVI